MVLYPPSITDPSLMYVEYDILLSVGSRVVGVCCLGVVPILTFDRDQAAQ